MIFALIAADVILASFAPNSARGLDFPALTCSDRDGKRFCRVAGQANCPRRSFVETIIIGGIDPRVFLDEGVRLEWTSPWKAPAGLKFVPATATYYVTEHHKEHGMQAAANEQYLFCSWRCKATRRHDAFVYGYCEVEAVPK